MNKAIRYFAIVIMLVLSLGVISNAYAEDGKIRTVSSNLFIIDNYTAYFFAKIENSGSVSIGTESGDLAVFSDEDEIILTESYVLTSPSYLILGPGEYAYATEFIWDSAIGKSSISDYKFSMKTDSGRNNVNTVACSSEFKLYGSHSYDNNIYVSFTNTTEKSIDSFFITFALFDDKNNIAYVESRSMDGITVHPGGSITVEIYINNDIVKYYEENSITTQNVDLIVYYLDS